MEHARLIRSLATCRMILRIDGHIRLNVISKVKRYESLEQVRTFEHTKIIWDQGKSICLNTPNQKNARFIFECKTFECLRIATSKVCVKN